MKDIVAITTNLKHQNRKNYYEDFYASKFSDIDKKTKYLVKTMYYI